MVNWCCEQYDSSVSSTDSAVDSYDV